MSPPRAKRVSVNVLSLPGFLSPVPLMSQRSLDRFLSQDAWSGHARPEPFTPGAGQGEIKEEEWDDQYGAGTRNVVQPTQLDKNETSLLSDKSSSSASTPNSELGEQRLWMLQQAAKIVEVARAAGLFEFLWHFLFAAFAMITVIAWVNLLFTCRSVLKFPPAPYY